MYRLKISIAVITMIQAVSGILGGLYILGIGIYSISVGMGTNHYYSGFLILLGIIALLPGIAILGLSSVWLFLGIKFCSKKPNKIIAIILLALNSIVSMNVIGSIVFILVAPWIVWWITLLISLVSVIMIALIGSYLFVLKKRNIKID